MQAAASVIASLESRLRRLRSAFGRTLARSAAAPRGQATQFSAAPGAPARPADGAAPDGERSGTVVSEGLLRGAVLADGELPSAVLAKGGLPSAVLPDGVPWPLRAAGTRATRALARSRALRRPGGSQLAVRPAAAGWRGRLWRLSDRWRRSLQLRVITATLVLSAVVVSVLGYVLMQHLVTELYDDKVQSSVNIVDAGLASAGAPTAFNSAPGQATRQAMYNLAQQLASTGVTPYALEVTLPNANQGPPVYSAGAAVGFYRSPPLLPQALASKVLAENSADHTPLQYWTSMAIASSKTPVPGLLIGASFGYEDRYQLYYFFPLVAEQQSIASMQRTLLLVGVAVVFLLAAIAWLVTRWVVIPVRLAARGARKLAAGALNERMDVRGTDELAALATSFNEMAASLQEKLAELEDLSQVQRQFVSDVSHELRTPLTTIRIASDVLFAVKSGLDPAAGRAAELLQSQLERFESLLTDLLEISRYDANAATLDAEAVDVAAIVRQSADVAQQLAERRGTKIEFRLPAEPCVAEVDRRRVERVLRNLLLNAVEHGEDKDVVVTAAMDSAAVAVSVRDFGVGLEPGEEQLVFDRFWRADPARARTSGGTGLGLSIALEDARLHGGWLEAWGEPGKGSVFRLTLPRTVGGDLPGSPLPLNPYSAGLDADLPGLAELAAPATAAPSVADPGQPPGDATPAAVALAGAQSPTDDTTPTGDSASADTASADPASADDTASADTASADTASADTASTVVAPVGAQWPTENTTPTGDRTSADTASADDEAPAANGLALADGPEHSTVSSEVAARG